MENLPSFRSPLSGITQNDASDGQGQTVEDPDDRYVAILPDSNTCVILGEHVLFLEAPQLTIVKQVAFHEDSSSAPGLVTPHGETSANPSTIPISNSSCLKSSLIWKKQTRDRDCEWQLGTLGTLRISNPGMDLTFVHKVLEYARSRNPRTFKVPETLWQALGGPSKSLSAVILSDLGDSAKDRCRNASREQLDRLEEQVLDAINEMTSWQRDSVQGVESNSFFSNKVVEVLLPEEARGCHIPRLGDHRIVTESFTSAGISCSATVFFLGVRDASDIVVDENMNLVGFSPACWERAAFVPQEFIYLTGILHPLELEAARKSKLDLAPQEDLEMRLNRGLDTSWCTSMRRRGFPGHITELKSLLSWWETHIDQRRPHLGIGPIVETDGVGEGDRIGL